MKKRICFLLLLCISSSVFASCQTISPDTTSNTPPPIATLPGYTGTFQPSTLETTQTLVNPSIDPNINRYPESKLKFSLSNDGKNYSCVGLGEETSTEIKIPAWHNGLPVTAIELSSYSTSTQLQNITKITIEEGITKISDYAFYSCTNLSSVIVPDSLIEITSSSFPKGFGNVYENSLYLGDTSNPYKIMISAEKNESGNYVIHPNTKVIAAAFKDRDVVNIVIPNGVTTIGNLAFYQCSKLSGVTIPQSVTSIGIGAFANCYQLLNLVIPNSVQTIGSGAFSSCSRLTNIEIPKSVTSIGSGAFKYCSNLSQMPSLGQTQTIEKETFFQCGLVNVEIPKGITHIEASAFAHCSSMESLTLPDGATHIGKEAFQYCTKLSILTLPHSLAFIGDSAFIECENLAKITFKGTKSKWHAVVKGAHWDDETPTFAVHCKDGIIYKNS